MDVPECAPPETDNAMTPSERTVEPASEQLMEEFRELYPEDDEPSSDERAIHRDSVLRPNCSRCVIFRDNCVHYLNTLSDLSPRIAALEALKPENKMLKKLNADLTTQLEEGMQAEQTLKARVAAAEEETTKVKAALDTLEKDFDAMAKAAEEGKKHAHEASVWRVKYEKTVDICERIQERRKKETANFDKMLNLAEGYKKELEATKAKVQEDREQNILFREAARKYIPSLYTLLKEIMSNPAFKTVFSANILSEAARLCSPDVKRALRVIDPLDEEDRMSEELERLVTAGPSKKHLNNAVEPTDQSGMNHPVETLSRPGSSLSKPASAGPSNIAPDFLLSELNDEEADSLLALGAEAATMSPARVAVKGVGSRGRGRGGGGKRGRGSKQVQAPTFAASVDHDEVTRRYNEILESKLKRSGREAPEPCSSGMKHMSIHGKKTVSIREQQEAQMKISIKEKVAMMKKLSEAGKKTTETLEGEEPALEKDSQAVEAPIAGSQNDQDASPTKSKTNFSLARHDLLLSASPSPASSIAEGETSRRVDADAIDLLALEEFGTVDQDENSRNAEIENEGTAVMIMEDVQPSAEDVSFTDAQQQPLTEPQPPKEDNIVVDKQPVEGQDHIIESDVRAPVEENAMDSSTLPGDGGVEEGAPEDVDITLRDVEPEQVEKAVEESSLVEEGMASATEVTTPTESDPIVKPTTENTEEPTSTEISDPAMEHNTEHTEEPASTEISDPAVKPTTEHADERTSTEISDHAAKPTTEHTEEAIDIAAAESASIAETPAAESVDVETASQVEETGVDEEKSLPNAEIPPVVEVQSSLPSTEKTSSVAETGIVPQVFVKPPKPHLAKDTKRALGLMRRLEVDLKQRVEPMPEFSGTSRKGSLEEQSPDTQQSLDSAAATEIPEKSARASLTGAPEDMGNSTKVDEGPPPNSAESNQNAIPEDNATSSSPSVLESHIIEKDHEEAMRLHAQLNLPALRTRKEVDHVLRDSSARVRSSKADACAKDRDKRIPQADAGSGKLAHGREIIQKVEAKPAKPKEPPQMEQTDMDDVIQSILAGARVNLEPSRVALTPGKAAPPAPEVNPKSPPGNLSPSKKQELAGPSDVANRGRQTSQIPTTPIAAPTTGQKSSVPVPSQTHEASPAVLRNSQESTVTNDPNEAPKSSTILPGSSKRARHGSGLEEKVAQAKRGRPAKVFSPNMARRDAAASSPVQTRRSSHAHSGEEAKPKRDRPEEEPKNLTQGATKVYSRTRGRASLLTSPTPSHHSTRDGSSEEDVPPSQESNREKVESNNSEPRVTRSRTRSLTESLTSPPLSRRTSRINSNENEESSSTRKSSTSKDAQIPEKKQQTASRQKPTTPQIREKPEKEKQTSKKEAPSQSVQKSGKGKEKADEESVVNSRKRSFQKVESFPLSSPPLSTKRLKTLSVRLQADSSPASRTRTKVGTTTTPVEEIEYGPHSRIRSRTGPVAPRKRKAMAEATEKKSAPTADCLSEASTDDEDRLCVAVEDEEEEHPKQENEKPISQMVENDDEEGQLVIDSEEGEIDEEESDAKNREGNAETTTGSKTVVTKEDTRVSESAAESQSDVAVEASAAVSKTPNSSSQGTKVRKLPSPDENPLSGLRSSTLNIHGERRGALQAARRSVPSFNAGPAAMQKFSARIAKQLQKGGSAVTRTAAAATRSPQTAAIPSKQQVSVDHPSSSTPVPKASSRAARSSTLAALKRNADKEKGATQQSNASPSIRGSKRRIEESTPDNGSVPKRVAPSESALQKKLHGALLSEQKIEVIRKNLGEDVNEIAKMDPEEFAATMVKCSLNLPSGDMWTIVQANYRLSESLDIHNKKEDAFMNIARELSGSAQIWVEYIKKLIATMTNQAPNVVNTTRYIRLLCQALCQTNSLLTSDEKKGYLRAALTRIFLDDTGIAIKATTYALLSPAYEWLNWMSDKDDPFSVLLSLGVTAAQNDGKILLWAWFQQFPHELQLHDVSPTNLRKIFDELMARLDQLADDRKLHVEQGSRSTKVTQEEMVLLNMIVAYFFAGSAANDVIKVVVGSMLSESIDRVKLALNPRATEGEKAWTEAIMVNNRLRLCTNIVLKGLGYRDNSALSREFCELLQRHVPTVRDLREEIGKLTPERPWLEMYHDTIQNMLDLVKTLSQYEI